MTQLHRTDNIWLLSSAKLLSLGLSFYLIYRHELESVFTWQRQQMCLENQRAHLQSVRLWDCWQRARILVGLVFFFLMMGNGSSDDKASSKLPVTKKTCSTEKIKNKIKKKLIHTSVQSENIFHSWKCWGHLLRTIKLSPQRPQRHHKPAMEIVMWKPSVILDRSVWRAEEERADEGRSWGPFKCSVTLVGSWGSAQSCQNVTWPLLSGRAAVLFLPNFSFWPLLIYKFLFFPGPLVLSES